MDDRTDPNNAAEPGGEEKVMNAPACCSNSACCCSAVAGGRKNFKMMVFIIIMIGAAVVLAHSIIRKSNTTLEQKQPAFTSYPTDGKPCIPMDVNPIAKTSGEAKSNIPSMVSDTTKPVIPGPKTDPVKWPEIDSFASLNKVAASFDAVFVLLTDDRERIQTIAKEVEAASRKIEQGGIHISTFILKEGGEDYAQLLLQVSLPCVYAMVKGRGVSGVSGEITEAKLLQAVVMASRPVSGCNPGQCGPTGCK